MAKNKMKRVCMALAICLNISGTIGFAADLTIDDAVNMALSKNNNVKIANEEKLASEARYEAAKGSNSVNISLNSSFR